MIKDSQSIVFQYILSKIHGKESHTHKGLTQIFMKLYERNIFIFYYNPLYSFALFSKLLISEIKITHDTPVDLINCLKIM